MHPANRRPVAQDMDGASARRQEDMESKLLYASASGNLEYAKRMVECRVLVNAADYNSRTALHLAAVQGHTDIVEYLLDEAADVTARDKHGESPLRLAIEKGQASVEEILRRAGAGDSEKSTDILTVTDPKYYLRAKFAIMESFPRPVALAMLDGRKIEPIEKDNVSIFFSSVVGYSSMVSAMDPLKVTKVLYRLFEKFDKLAYIHGVHKIDVLGDVYMASANFMEDAGDDHAARLARFAVDAMKAARETSIDEGDPENSGCVNIQVGMHCGAVSGSVIGCQSIKYTLHGDAVNTASRMMSTSLANRIQCSEESATLISDQAHEMIFRERTGGVDVKGKGRMQTYWMSSFRQGPHLFDSCPDLLRPAHRKGSFDSVETASTVEALDIEAWVQSIELDMASQVPCPSLEIALADQPAERAQQNLCQYKNFVENQCTDAPDPPPPAAGRPAPGWHNWRSHILRL